MNNCTQPFTVAVSIVRVLGANGGVLQAEALRRELRYDLGFVPQNAVIQQAARILRDRGVALVTSAARHKSTWMIAPPGTADYDRWVTWVLRRHYKETITAYRSLAPDPNLSAQKGVLYRSAMDCGMLLGMMAPDINADLTTPIPVERDLRTALVAGGFVSP